MARPFTNQLVLTYGTLVIEGSVGAQGTSSPIGTTTPSLTDGNGGNTLSTNGRDATRGIMLETPRASFARTLTPGGGSAVTPTASALYGTGGSNLMNGHRFGCTNTGGTVTFSNPINPGNVPVSAGGTAGFSGGTNPVRVVHNIALLSATGGTENFAGAITGSTLPTLGATNASAAATNTGTTPASPSIRPAITPTSMRIRMAPLIPGWPMPCWAPPPAAPSSSAAPTLMEALLKCWEALCWSMAASLATR